MKKYKPYMYFSNHLMSGIAGFGFAKKTKKPPNGWFLLIFGGPGHTDFERIVRRHAETSRFIRLF
jgi:hypothetical protein